MKVLLTGAAGLIDSALALRLLERGDTVIGIDNHNDYYDPVIKEARQARHASHPNYTHLCIDIGDRKAMKECFTTHKPQRVVNLAAQAGVRYSTENPFAYIDRNIVGSTHIQEGCRHNGVEHLVYASSSSVYGANTTMPFSVLHNVDHPLSLYAASKKSNELMAHTYSHLYSLPTPAFASLPSTAPGAGLTWRSSSSPKPFLRAKKPPSSTMASTAATSPTSTTSSKASPCAGQSAQPYPTWSGAEPDSGTSKAPWRVYNIGNNSPVELMGYIAALEKARGKKGEMDMLPLQPGDVPDTYADVSDLVQQFHCKPTTPVDLGVANFVA